MDSELPEEIRSRLREAPLEELARLLVELGDRLDPGAARLVLRNPFATAELIGDLLSVPRLAGAYDFRRDVAFDPRSRQSDALRCVATLYWVDLVRLGCDTRLHPIVRRAADSRLIERLPGLALGEKMAIARAASLAVLATLRLDPSPRVIGSLLENPRLTEGALLPLASSEQARSQVLAVLAASPRWGVRYPLRVALARNPQTPPSVALGILPMLKKSDLAAVAADARLAGAVRLRARLLATRGPERV